MEANSLLEDISILETFGLLLIVLQDSFAITLLKTRCMPILHVLMEIPKFQHVQEMLLLIAMVPLVLNFAFSTATST